MPNWCNNSVTVSHPDKEMMKKFSHGVITGSLFASLIPLSCVDWDYYVATQEWGTKWDCLEGDFNLDEDGLSGNGWFDTAWGPPIRAYERLKALGFYIESFFSESGMGFCGTWIDGEEECIGDYFEKFENPHWRENLETTNSEILDYLDSEYESWLENSEEEE